MSADLSEQLARSTRFTLHSHGLASYAWSTQIITLSGFAAKPDIRRRLAATAERTAPWTSALEFRAAAASTHELCHYLQDVGSGAGHRDLELSVRFLRTGAFRSVILAEDLGHLRSVALSAIGRDAARHWDEYIDARAFVPRSMETSRRAARRTVALRGLGSLDDAYLDCFSLEFILELEAYLYTIQHLRGFEMTNEQVSIFAQQQTCVALSAMPAESQTLFNTICVQLGADPSSLKYEVVGIIAALVTLLVECALAVPPPPDGTVAPLQAADMPEIRFAMLLIALSALDDTEMERLVDAVGYRRHVEAEAILAGKMRGPYAMREDHERTWLAKFIGWEKSDDKWHALFRNRARIAESRWLRSVSPASSRSTNTLVFDHATPIYRTREGYAFGSTDPELLLNRDKAFEHIAVHDALGHQMALAEYLSGAGAFYCHGAVDDQCRVRRAVCRSSDADLTAIADIGDGCAVRQSLGAPQRLIVAAELAKASRRRRTMKRTVDQVLVDAVMDHTAAHLQAELVDGGSLKMDLPYELIGALAEKVVAGVISGFASRWLYDEWKDRRTKQVPLPANAAIDQEIQVAPQVPEDEMVLDIVVELTAEGVGAERAEQLARSTVSYVATIVEVDAPRLR